MVMRRSDESSEMAALKTYAEIIGPYQVGFVSIYSAKQKRKVWTWAAELNPDRSPLIPLPSRARGRGDTLAEARNDARERLPATPWHPKNAGIQET